RSNPLVFIGYNVIGFDLPVLVLKMRQLNEKSKQYGKYRPNYWAFIEVLGKSYFLDMMDPIKSEIAKFDNASPRFISLENAISHKRFSHIPFMRTKNIVSDITNNSTINKWDAIYNLWKNDKNSFNKYIEGDVHDTLLLAENCLIHHKIIDLLFSCLTLFGNQKLNSYLNLIIFWPILRYKLVTFCEFSSYMFFKFWINFF